MDPVVAWRAEQASRRVMVESRIEEARQLALMAEALLE